MKIILFVLLFLSFSFSQNTYSISFDGGDYLYLNSAYRGSDTQGTVSMWIKPTDTDNFDALFTVRTTGNINYFVRLRFYGSGVEVDTKNNDTETAIEGTTTDITLGEWTHIALVCSTKSQLYVNGVKQTMNLRGGADDGEWIGDLSTTGNQLLIGTSTGIAQFYTGLMDEVSYFSVPLTDDQVAFIYNGGIPKDISGMSGLEDYWGFNEGTGTTTINSDADITLGFAPGGQAPSWSTDTPGWDAGVQDKGFKEYNKFPKFKGLK